MKLLGHALCRTATGFGLTLCAVVSLTFGPHSIGHVRARQVAPAVDGFAVIGTHDLGARGLNAGLALAGACAYVGSRGEGSVAILDISDPAAPDIIGQIAPVAGSTTRELRVDPELALLAILTFRLDRFSAAPNRIDLYDITACAQPRLAGQIDFGESLPHEFIFWRDPDSTHAGRLLTYVAMWGYTPNLRVFDLTDPARPVALTQWDAGAVTNAVSMLHSLSVSPDGTRAYAADWLLGTMALDTSAVARNEVTPGINLLTPPESWVVLPGGNHHSAVPIPGSNGLVTTQEIYGFGTCPYARIYLLDAAQPAELRVTGQFGIAENDPALCGQTEARDGAFSPHNVLVVADLAFATWYAGGLRVVDLRDWSNPAEVAFFVPDPLPEVLADDFTLGSYPIRMWSTPVLQDGLLYVIDIRNGLYILEYTGPRAGELITSSSALIPRGKRIAA